MQATYNLILSAGENSISENTVVTADTANPLQVDIPVALVGELTTRTDDDTGIITLVADHGITTADFVDLYDATTGELLRKDVDITAADSTTISINVGTGSNLPVVNTDLIVGKQVPFLPTILPDTIKLFGIQLKIPGATTKGRVCFKDASPAVAGSGDGDINLVANAGQIFNVEGGADNPLAGDPVVTGVVSQANTTLPAVLQIISLEDRTP